MHQLQQFINSLNKPKNYLLLANVFLVFFLILLNNLKIIPLRTGDFAFFAILTLALAMYRPGWAFLFFIGTIPLENINLAPTELGIDIRPYQFIGALTIAAFLIRMATKRLNFKLAKLNLADYLVIILVFSGFVSALAVGAIHELLLRLSVILASFALLYFLARNYIQSVGDLKKVLPFFLSSSVIVTFYGIWQNWAFTHNLSDFEVMPGRPNATFTEADWLGGYLVLLISVVYAYIYSCHSERSGAKSRNLPTAADDITINRESYDYNSQIPRLRPDEYIRTSLGMTRLFALYFLLATLYIILILTVSRSAWLGAFAATFIFLFIAFTDLKFDHRNWRWKETFFLKLKILASLAISLAVIYVFNLTNFQLFNRAQSTGTGLQKITISCPPYDWVCEIPDVIEDIKELEKCECKQINLEDIEKSGGIILEVYRKDPNVKIRSQIYQKSWAEIKKHPILGIGWGNIGSILGTDERGASFNSSNIFLETWLGAGIIGFASIIVLFSYILLNSIKNYFFAQDQENKVFYLFLIISWFAIIIPNLFNAGIFLGFLWVWLAVAQVSAEG